MKKRSSFSALLYICLIAMLILSAAVLVSCDGDEESVTEILSARIKDEEIKVTATLEKSYAEEHSSDTLYLLALQSMDRELSLDGAVLVGESRAKKKMTFEFSSCSGTGISHVSSAFVLAEKTESGYAPITSLAYVENPEEISVKEVASVSSDGIKGYISDDAVGMKLLGADHLLIEAEMNELILEDYNSNSVRFDLDGVSYYYDKDEVERIDKLMADAKSASMRVYIRSVLRAPNENTPGFLYYKWAYDKQGFLPDLSNRRAVRYIRAFTAFLASRYDFADLIVGEKVNDYGRYCHAGNISSDEFELLYSYWARLSHQTLRSVNSAAQIYISVDNTWRQDSLSGSMGAKAFLQRFADRADDEGGYGYNIAMSLGDATDYAALVSGRGYDYSRIGVTNISDLTKLLESGEMRYKGERRSVIIDGLTVTTSIKEKDRASYYAFAYYSAAENGFDAVIYSGSVYSAENTRSDLYYAMLMCGTDLNSQLNDYTDRLPDVRVPEFNDHIVRHLSYSQKAFQSIDESTERNKKPISLDPSGFGFCGSVFNSQGMIKNDGDGDLFSLRISADLSDASGAVFSKIISSEELISSAYVGITMSSDYSTRVALLISDGDRVYIGETDVSGEAQTYYFDIKGFSKHAEVSEDMVLSLCLLNNGEGDRTLEISEMAFFGSSGNGAETVVTVVVVAVIALSVLGLIVLLALSRKKKKSVRYEDDD